MLLKRIIKTYMSVITKNISNNTLENNSYDDFGSYYRTANLQKPIEIEAQISTLNETSTNLITKMLYYQEKNYIILAYFGGKISIWNYDLLTKVIDIPAHQFQITDIILLRPNSFTNNVSIQQTLANSNSSSNSNIKNLVSCSYDGMIRFWELNTFECIRSIKGLSFLWVHDLTNGYLLSYSNMYYQIWDLNLKHKNLLITKWKGYNIDNIKSHILKITKHLYIVSSLTYIELYSIKKQYGMKLLKRFKTNNKCLIRRITNAINHNECQQAEESDSEYDANALNNHHLIFITYDFLDTIDLYNIYNSNLLYKFKGNFAVDHILMLSNNTFLSGGIDEGISIWNMDNLNQPIAKIKTGILAGYGIIIHGPSKNSIIVTSFDIYATKVMNVHIINFDDCDL